MKNTQRLPLGNRMKSYFSKPANVICVVFLVLLILMVVLPLFTLLIGSLTVNGNQEAIYIGNGAAEGDFTFHLWT